MEQIVSVRTSKSFSSGVSRDQRWAYGVRKNIWSRFDERNRTDICLVQIEICTDSVRIEKKNFLFVQTKYRQVSVITLDQTQSRFLSVFCLYEIKNIFSIVTDSVQILIWTRSVENHNWAYHNWFKNFQPIMISPLGPLVAPESLS